MIEASPEILPTRSWMLQRRTNTSNTSRRSRISRSFCIRKKRKTEEGKNELRLQVKELGKEKKEMRQSCEGDWMKKGRGEIRACVCVHLSIGCNQIQKLLFLIHYIYLRTFPWKYE